jgi:Dolichyl-phosphate-mannose-protein mannosyltransferase
MTTLTLPQAAERGAVVPAVWSRIRHWAPLAAIVAVQAALTVRLIPTGFASTDEGRYIDAGHQLIYEFWHGGGSPYFETYFSGAPDFYSPLAAMADYLGGLAAVRLMSTAFSLVTTSLLFSTTKRLFGYWPAVTSAAIFAGLSLTQVVGRNAIYDALALMLMAVAGYCAARAEPGAAARWLLLVPVALLAADFAKYITLLFNGSVILIAAYQMRSGGIGAMVKRTAVLGLATGSVLVLGLFVAGSAYVQGIMFTTLGRKSGASALLGAQPTSAVAIAEEAWHWFGLVLIAGFAAALMAAIVRRERAHAWFLLMCAVTGTLVTLEALHLHSDESVSRHDDFAAWFACIASGYILARISGAIRLKGPRAIAAAVVMAFVLYSAAVYSFGLNSFGNPGAGISTETVTALPQPAVAIRPYLATGGRYLLSGSDDYALTYNTHVFMHWWNLIDDNYIKYPIPGRGGDWHGEARGPVCAAVKPGCMYLEGANAYRAAVKAHDLDLVSVTRTSLPMDIVIEHAVESTPGYVLLTTAGGGPTWIYAPYYERVLSKRQSSAEVAAGR